MRRMRDQFTLGKHQFASKNLLYRNVRRKLESRLLPFRKVVNNNAFQIRRTKLEGNSLPGTQEQRTCPEGQSPRFRKKRGVTLPSSSNSDFCLRVLRSAGNSHLSQ